LGPHDAAQIARDGGVVRAGGHGGIGHTAVELAFDPKQLPLLKKRMLLLLVLFEDDVVLLLLLLLLLSLAVEFAAANWMQQPITTLIIVAF
jgi:hypothetical protein